ncbi:MAG: N-acetylmuramoyl-L-alanine amidase, partial [Candidatus Phaeomarinobacter sp.]
PVLAQDVAPSVTDVRLGKSGDTTRFVLELSGKVEAKAFTLADPHRLIIDLPALDWELASDFVPAGRGLISSFRYGLFRPGNARVVIDLSGPAKVSRSFVLPPDPANNRNWRIVFDLVGTPDDAFRAVAGWPDAKPATPSVATPAPNVPSAKPPSNARKVVVIDAGHGGVDPGAIGGRGTREKNVTLAFAKALGEALRASGKYEVHLTRDKDIFIELRERVAIARRRNADLFISVHADSIERRDVRGAAVYTLSEKASDAEAARLARKENEADVIAGVNLGGDSDDVRDILIDLAQRETKNLSVRFAQTVIPKMSEVTKILRNTHRFAGFRVLKAPDVPSVLIELGFLTNSEDELSLTSSSWRRKTSLAIARGVDAYFAERHAEASQ